MNVGDVLITRFRVPGSPVDIPAGAPVLVEEIAHHKAKRVKDAGKYGRTHTLAARSRLRVNYKGHFYWIDSENLESP